MSETHLEQLQRLMHELSEDKKAEAYLREFWQRRSQHSDRDRTPIPNTFREAECRIAFFHRYWRTRLPPEPIDEIEMIMWTGRARDIINRLPVFTRAGGSIAENAGWLAAIREARNAPTGGLQYVYDQMVNHYIFQFADHYADTRIMQLIPPEAGLEEVRAYWNAFTEWLGPLAPEIARSTEVEFLGHFRNFIKVEARNLDQTFRRLNPHGLPPETR